MAWGIEQARKPKRNPSRQHRSYRCRFAASQVSHSPDGTSSQRHSGHRRRIGISQGTELSHSPRYHPHADHRGSARNASKGVAALQDHCGTMMGPCNPMIGIDFEAFRVALFRCSDRQRRSGPMNYRLRSTRGLDSLILTSAYVSAAIFSWSGRKLRQP